MGAERRWEPTLKTWVRLENKKLGSKSGTWRPRGCVAGVCAGKAAGDRTPWADPGHWVNSPLSSTTSR